MTSSTVLQLDPSPRNARNSEATFLRLASGRILYVWSKFIGDNHSDFGSGVIASRYSDDGGRTWSARDRILVAKEGSTNVMSPSLLRLQDGRIALLNLRKDGARSCQPWIRFSDDEGETFSKPARMIPEEGYYVVNNDRIIQTRAGRIIVPVIQHRYRLPSELKPMERLPGDTKTHYPKKLETFFASPGLVFFLFSDDGGKTWLESLTSLYECFSNGHGLQEPGVVELSRGKLWAFMRTGEIGVSGSRGRQWESFSKDAGVTWSDARPSKFYSPCSPMQVKRHPARNLLVAVWNDHSGRFKTPRPLPISWGRTPLACAASLDDGKTWRGHMLLESAPDHGFCYPAVHFTDDDAVLISYNAGGASTRNPLDRQRVKRVMLSEMNV